VEEERREKTPPDQEVMSDPAFRQPTGFTYRAVRELSVRF